jgi:hypothetical protein
MWQKLVTIRDSSNRLRRLRRGYADGDAATISEICSLTAAQFAKLVESSHELRAILVLPPMLVVVVLFFATRAIFTPPGVLCLTLANGTAMLLNSIGPWTRFEPGFLCLIDDVEMINVLASGNYGIVSDAIIALIPRALAQPGFVLDQQAETLLRQQVDAWVGKDIWASDQESKLLFVELLAAKGEQEKSAVVLRRLSQPTLETRIYPRVLSELSDATARLERRLAV